MSKWQIDELFVANKAYAIIWQIDEKKKTCKISSRWQNDECIISVNSLFLIGIIKEWQINALPLMAKWWVNKLNEYGKLMSRCGRLMSGYCYFIHQNATCYKWLKLGICCETILEMPYVMANWWVKVAE